MAEPKSKGQRNAASVERPELPDKARLVKRLTALKSERAPWLPMYQDLSDNIQPYAGRFYATDRNRGDMHTFNNIIDDTATAALDILAAGLMGGLTSPARPWFRLGVGDPTLKDDHEVKTWLSECQRIMLNVFAKSNTYLALHNVYYELGLFGTACSVVMDDYDSVIHHYTSPVGEFCLAADFKGRTNTLYREFQKTVGEVVREFGYENCSISTKTLYDRNALDSWITVYHTLEPRVVRDPTKLDGKNKPWRSTYFEVRGDDKTMLRDGGMDEFRALAPRWHKTGGDIYGRSPGMRALGAVKQLQHEQIRKANGIDQMTRPSLQAPMSLKNSDIDMLPGGITFVDTPGSGAAVQNLMNVNIDLNHLSQDMEEVRQRIRAAFYSDLFLLITGSTDVQKTAAEIAERHEEKMLVLGPVLERLDNELLRPLIDITFNRCSAAGMFPPAPEALHDHALEIEYISVLAQAQRMIATNGIDRWVGALGSVSAFKPDVLDKFNSDKWADSYGDLLGVDPDMINSDDQVAAIRQQRAEAQKQAQMAQQANMAADTAAKLGSVQTPNGNMTTDLMNQISGYGSPSGTEL